MAGLEGTHGVGLGLRWAFMDEVLEEGAGSIPFFELSPENYMRRGGYFPEAVERIADRHPVISHGLMLNIGASDPLDRDYLDALRAFLGRIAVSAHSDHLCWTGTEGRTLHDLLPLPTHRGVIDHLVDRIRRVQDHLGMPVALENISYYLVPGGDAPEHEWVAEVVERADCGLLLDVNNVWVNAQNHDLDPYEILRTMPLDRVVHLHVAGGERLARFDDLVIDTHGTDVSPKVVELMQWVLERTGPRPVVYERDHDIPELDELQAQVQALQSAYDAALARATSREADETATKRIERVELTSDAAPALRDTQRVFARFVLDPSFEPSQVSQQPELGEVSPARVEVYRRLVRNAMRSTIRRFIPRTAARLGDARFEAEVWAWLADEGPRSRFFRDVPLEFGRFIERRWPALGRADGADTLPPYLLDLARHELIEMEVDAAAPAPAVEAVEGEVAGLDLAAAIRFDPAVRLARYAHAVHELPIEVDDRSSAPPRATTLLVYRDPEHEVRFLSLSPFGAALCERLLAGCSLGEAVSAAAADAHETLDDTLLVRAATLLADLAERGAALGPAAPTNRGP